MPTREEMLDGIETIVAAAKERKRQEREALRNAERDLANTGITEYAANRVKRRILTDVRGRMGLNKKGPLWFSSHRLTLSVRPDKVELPGGNVAWSVALHLERPGVGKYLQVNCLLEEAHSVGIWMFLFTGAQMRLFGEGVPPPPVPMAKQLAEKGLNCRYVWTLAAAAACAVEGC